MFRSPLRPEHLEVLDQLLPAVDAQTLERAAAEMMDEDVERHEQPEAGLAGADTQVIVVKEANAEPLVE